MRLNNKRGDVTINIMKIKGITLFFVVLLTTSVLAVVPTFTSVNPGSLPQGAIDELTIVGTNFQSGITVEISGSGVVVPSVSFESSTQIKPNVIVASDATVGARDILLYNPGESVVRASGYFSITASGTGPAISVYFDGTKYITPITATVYPATNVEPTYEARILFTSTLPATLSADSLNATITSVTSDLSSQSIIPFASNTVNINTSNITQNSSTSVTVIATIETEFEQYLGQIMTVYVTGSNVNGDSNMETFLVYLAEESDQPPPTPAAEGLPAKDTAYAIPVESEVDLNTTKQFTVQVRTAPDRILPSGVTLYLFDNTGKLKWSKVINEKIINKKNIQVDLNNAFAKQGLHAGIYTFKIVNNATGKPAGMGKIFLGW